MKIKGGEKKMTKTITLETTNNYKQFRYLRGNRAIRNAHLKWLINSIAKKNLLEYYPIIVNDTMHVIDGQHRLEAARYLKIEVPYRIMSGANLTDAQILNQSVRPWLTQDYLDSWIEQGKEPYKKLGDFREKYGVSVTHALHLITRQLNTGTREIVFAEFKVGGFHATDKQFAEAEILAQRLIELQEFSVDKLTRSREFVQALLFVYDKVEHEEIIRQLKRSGDKLERKYGFKGYLYQFEELLNRRKKGGNRELLFGNSKTATAV